MIFNNLIALSQRKLHERGLKYYKSKTLIFKIKKQKKFNQLKKKLL